MQLKKPNISTKKPSSEGRYEKINTQYEKKHLNYYKMYGVFRDSEYIKWAFWNRLQFEWKLFKAAEVQIDKKKKKKSEEKVPEWTE